MVPMYSSKGQFEVISCHHLNTHGDMRWKEKLKPVRDGSQC
jgi:hypothetical protein